MRPRLALAVVLAFMLPFAVTAAAIAGPPVSTTEHADFTFQSQLWTSTCGVPVFIHQEGTVTLRLVSDSNVIHELDTFPGWTVTVFSPVEEGGTGKSFTFIAAFPHPLPLPRGD